MDYTAKDGSTRFQKEGTMRTRFLKRADLIVVMLLLTACSGCTARTAYESLHYNRELDCQKMLGTADREECLKRSGMSYDEYQHRLNKDRNK